MLSYLKKNLQTFVLVLIVIGLGFSVYFLGNKVGPNKPLALIKSEDTACQNNLVETSQVSLGNLPPYGQANAPIKIVEFSDYLCPFCAITAVEFYPQIESLIKNGEVAIFYRDFPLHPNADLIANAARCANEQGKFWDFNLKIFEKFITGQNTAQQNVWFDIAKELNLDQQQFKACVESNKYAQEIKNDLSYGSNQRLSGTPTFFIQSGDKAFKVVGIDKNCLMSGINKFKNPNQ